MEKQTPDDSFFDFCVENDQQSLNAIESAIAALQQSGAADPNSICVDDIPDQADATRAFDISNLVRSEVPEEQTQIKETLQNPQILSVKNTLFKKSEQSKVVLSRQTERCTSSDSFQTQEFKWRVVLPIVLLGQDRTTTQFYTALRVVGFGGDEVVQLLKSQLIHCVASQMSEGTSFIIAALLSQRQFNFLAQFYCSQSEESRCRIVEQFAAFFQTQNYFDQMQIVASADVTSYKMTRGRFIINQELVDLYQARAARKMPVAPPRIDIEVEAFLYGEIRKETSPQCFCQLLNCLHTYCEFRALSSDEKRQKFIRMLFAQFQRITSPTQQTSLIIGVFAVLMHGQITVDVLERFIGLLLQQNLAPQSRRSIRLCLQKIKTLPQIDGQLQDKLIRANYCDFFVYFGKTREYLIRQLEAGNTNYYPLIDQIVLCADPSASCRLFASFLVRIKSEKSFVIRLKLGQLMQKLVDNIRPAELQLQFNMNSILAALNPQTIEDCRKMFCAFHPDSYDFLRFVTPKTAWMICYFKEKYGDGQGKATFSRFFSDSHYLSRFE